MSVEVLGAAERRIVEQETELLVRTQRLMAEHAARDTTEADYDRELISLRDQLAEARAEDHAALVEHMTRLASLRARAGAGRALPADPRNPYFAHLRLRDRESDEVRDIMIGRRAFIDTQQGVTVVDWRNSPISRIYYRYEEGDEYEESFAGQTRLGVVELRRTLTIADGHLSRVQSGDIVLVRAADADWTRAQASASRLEGGVGTAIRPPVERLGRHGKDYRLPEITALIDPDQFSAIASDRSGVVIVSGGAGTGKTTIALHRAAFLHFADPKRFATKRMLVITPGDALRRYVASVLPALDVQGVSIQTFPRWAFDTLKRLVPALRKRKLTDETPMGARRLKRLPSVLAMAERWLAQEARSYDPVFEEAGGKALLNAWVSRRNLAPVPRLRAVRKWVDGPGRHVLGGRAVAARLALQEARETLGNPLEAWATLLSDRTALARGFELDGIAHYQWELDQLVDTVARQADDPVDYSDLDADRRQGIDGRSLGEGDIEGRFDVDDLAVLLRFCQLMFGALEGPSGQSVSYQHIVVDEAQDLTPMALKVLVDAGTRKDTPITLAGDTAQKIYFDNGFDDWDELIPHLKVPVQVLPPLAVTYRSTSQVMALARHVLGDLAPHEAPRDARDGAPVEFLQFPELGQSVAFVADALKNLRMRERRASVALVSRNAEVADLYYEALVRAEVPAVRRVRQQEFDFSPGIDVTDIFQVKGLEYDYVLLLEPTARLYPDAIESRHLLHVGATRAAHQLWLICADRPSPLLPNDLVSGT